MIRRPFYVSKMTSSGYFRRLRRLLDSIEVVRNSGCKAFILSSLSGDSGIDLGIFGFAEDSVMRPEIV